MSNQELVDSAALDATRLLRASYGAIEGLERIDPVAIAQSLGVDVFRGGLPENVAGLLVKRFGQDPEIHINLADSENRRRFTVAHELGHYIRNTATRDDDVIDRVDYRANLAAKGIDREEIYANSFAAQLLMPHQLVRPAWRAGAREPDLASRFQVSVGAMTNRVKNLGLR